MRPKFFHYISYLRIPFTLWGIFTVYYSAFMRSPDLVSDIGFGIFLCGLGLGFGGLSDSRRISKREKKTFLKPKKIKLLTVYFIVGVSSVNICGIVFLSLNFATDELTSQYENLAYGCMALGLGMLCELKLFYDKYEYFRNNEVESVEDIIK